MLRYTFFLSLLLFSGATNAEIITNQPFATAGIPAGWTTTAIQGAATWTVRNTPGFGSTSGSYYAVFDDEALGGAVTPNEAALTSPALNCTNHLAVYLKIQHYWYGVEGTYGYVEVSNDGGTSWNTIYTLEKLTKGSLAAPHDTTFDITAWAANQSNVKVRFRYSDGNQSGKYWYVDDIVVFSEPDLSPTQLIVPDFLNCSNAFSSNQNIQVRVYNKGVNPISNVPITVDISGVYTGSITEIIPGPIAGQSYVDYSFTTTFDMSAEGLYNFLVYTEYATEKYFPNDTLRQARHSHVYTLPYTEDFNVNTGGWQSGGTNNVWAWGTTAKMGGSGSNAWVTNLTASYNNSENAWLQSPPFDLTDLYADPVVSFDVKYNTESCCDRLYFEFSTNGGTSWTTLRTYAGSSASSWVHASDTLKFTDCNTSCVLFRFRLTSDGSVVSDGAIIDNFVVTPNATIHDLDAVDIHFTNRCSMGAAEQIGLSIRNKSLYPACNIPVKVIITHPTLPTQTITGIVAGPLLINQRVNYYFPTTVDLSGAGTYTFYGIVEDPLDGNASNDTVVRTEPVVINTYPYSDNFDASINNWVANGNVNHTWECDAITDMGGPQGNGRSWSTNMLGNYNNSDASYLYSPRLDFSAMSCPYITFDLKWLTESCCDYLTCEYSLNGGTTWSVLGVAGEPYWYNSGTTWRDNSGNVWKPMQHNLTPLAGNACVLLRFRFASDGSSTYSGVAIDNIQIFDNLDDVGVSAIVTPSGICNNSANEPVTITVRNYGCQSVSNIPVNFEYSGPNSGSLSGVVPGPIAPGASANFTFAGTIDLSALGTYVLSAYTSLITDLNHTNDTFHSTLVIDVPRITAVPYLEDFNSNNGYWISGGTNNSWQYGVFTDMGGDQGYGASWSTSLVGNYNNSENSWIESPVYDLGLSPDPVVEFDIKYTTESCCDRVYFEYSNNGGTTFNTVTSWIGTSSNVWIHYSDTVFTNTCNNSCIRFRFRLASDGSVVNPGVAIDNFNVVPNTNINKAEIVDLHFNNRCAHTSTESIGISVRNTGFNVLCNVPVYCLVTHPTQASQLLSTIIPGPVQPWQRVNVVFPSTADLSQFAAGQYTLTGWVDIATDPNHADDTIVRFAPDTITVYPYNATFDTWHENWVSNGNLANSWEIRDFAKMGGNAGYGKSWITNYRGNYNNSESSWVMSPLLDFSSLSCPVIEFDAKYNTESCCDWGQVQYSLNGGTTWVTLGTSADPNWYNSGTSWRGTSSSVWMHETHQLTPLANQPCVLIRFLFGSDGSATADGFGLDNIKIWNRNPDVSPILLVQPLANKEYCDRRLTETAVVRFYNYGCSSVSNVPFTFSYTGPNSGSFSEVVPGPIASGSYVDYTCTNTVDMSGSGAYNFTIISQLPADAYPDNDTLNTSLNQTFYQSMVVNSYPYLEDFDATNGGWIVHPSSVNGTMQWGAITDMGGPQGYGNCWATNLTGNYNNGEVDYLYSPVFDMTTLTSPFVELDLKFITEACCDYLYLEYSLNGGTTWATLGTSSDPDWYNSANNWRGNMSANWVHMGVPACALAGQSCVIFRFVFRTDGSAVYTGVAIDNFRVSDHFNDVGVVSILQPLSTNDLCLRRDNVPVQIRVKNFSCQPVSNIPVTFSMVGPNSASFTEIIPGPIASQGTLDYTFSSTVDLTQIGVYSLAAYTTLVGDVYLLNDTALSSINVGNYLGIVNTFPYVQNFNSGPDGWQTGGTTTFALGTFSKLGGNAGFGNSWMTNLSGAYSNGENGYILSPVFDLSSLSCAWIGFDYKFNTESCCDYATFEYSTNGGVSWSVLGTTGDYLNWFNSGTTWRGNGGTSWIHAEHNISFLAGQTCVIFRYRFATDGSVVSDGAAFDNFNIHSTPIDAALSNITGCYAANEPLKINVRNNNDGSTRFCDATAHITSIDVTTILNGGAPVTQTISGLDIAPGVTAVVDVPGVTVPNNSSTVFVRISMPNGNVDYVIYNDTMTVSTTNWPMCNDHCEYAIELYNGTTLASQTAFATTDPSEDPAYTGCQPMTLENTVWYFFQTDASGGDVTVTISGTVCTPSSNGLQVNILQVVNDPCDPSDNIELACYNNGNTSDIVFGPVALPANSMFLIVIDGYANNNCDFNITLDGAVPLPVELLNFDAHLNNGKVDLFWATASETNNDYFLIQRIPQGGSEFENIGMVDGFGTSNQINTYQTIDPNPLEGVSYYRLKQVDFDGNYSYSEIRAVNNSGEKSVQLFPNPVVSGRKVNICFSNEIEGEVTVELFDEANKHVNTETMKSASGHLCVVYTLSPAVKPGTYRLVVSTDAGTHSFTLVVAE